MIINSMVAHEAFQNGLPLGHRLTIAFGPSFLKEHFSKVAKLDFDISVFHLNEETNPSFRTLLQQKTLLQSV